MAKPIATSVVSKSRLLSTLNPLSSIQGDTDMYLGGGLPGHLLFKAGLIAAATAGITGAARALPYILGLSDSQAKASTKHIKEDLNTTFTPELLEGSQLNKTGAAEITARTRDGKTFKKLFSDKNGVARGLLAITGSGAALIGAGLGIRAVDKLFGAAENKKTQEDIKRHQQMLYDVMSARAMLARNTMTPEEAEEVLMRSEQSIAKHASMCKSAWFEEARQKIGGVGAAILLITAGASAAAAFAAHSARDPGNVQYRAAKKGLREYNATKLMKAPIGLRPLDIDEWADRIDKGIPAAATSIPIDASDGQAEQQIATRDLPEITESSNPITITL